MKMLRLSLLAAAVVLILVPCAHAVDIDYLVVVIDGSTSQPVAEALVKLASGEIGDYEQLTSSSGEALLPGVPEGEYSLTVSADGYDVVTETVTVDVTERRRLINVW